MKHPPFFISDPKNLPLLKRWALFNICVSLPEILSDTYLNLTRLLHSLGYVYAPVDSSLKELCFLHPMFQFYLRKKLEVSLSDEQWLKGAYQEVILGWQEQFADNSGDRSQNILSVVILEFQNLIRVHFLNLRHQDSIVQTIGILSYILNSQHKSDELIFLARKTLAQLNAVPKAVRGEHWQLDTVCVMDALGRALKSKRQLKEAKTVFQELLDFYTAEGLKSRFPEGLGELYRIQGELLRDIEDYPLSRAYTEKAVKIFEECHDNVSLSTAYMNIGRWHYDQAEYAEALKAYEIALHHIEAKEDSEQKGRILQQIAGVYYQTGAYEVSKQLYKVALKTAQKFYSDYHQAKALQGLGILASLEKNWKESLFHYGEALKIYLGLSSKYPYDIAQLYYNMGNDSYNLEEYGAAKDYYLEALAAYHDLGDQFKEAEIWQNLANVYYYLEEYTTSMSYDKRAFQLFCTQKRRQQLVEILHNAYQYALENEEGKTHAYKLVSLLLDHFPEETVKSINESAIHYQDKTNTNDHKDS